MGLSLRLAIQAHHLLSRGVRESGKNARLRHGRIALVFQDPADWNAFVAECAQQQLPGFVVADNTHRQHGDAEVGQVVDRIRAAARNHFAVAMPAG